MITCKVCGAELQNPLDRYCETSIEYLRIHSNKPHELNELTDNQKTLINTIKEAYFKLHDKYGRRIDTI